jgi:hypothetical protein
MCHDVCLTLANNQSSSPGSSRNPPFPCCCACRRFWHRLDPFSRLPLENSVTHLLPRIHRTSHRDLHGRRQIILMQVLHSKTILLPIEHSPPCAIAVFLKRWTRSHSAATTSKHLLSVTRFCSSAHYCELFESRKNKLQPHRKAAQRIDKGAEIVKPRVR